MKFLKLLSPLKIGNITLQNRVVMAAMNLNLADKGYASPEVTDFYVERAKGKAGLLMIGGIYVDNYGKGVPMMLSIEDDKFIPKLREMNDAIHHANEKVMIGAQLYHSGRYSFPQIIGETPISSSAVYNRFSKSTPRKMTLEDIEREKKAFTDAAVRAVKSGYDCIEICGSAGYLMDQFLSPLVNKREDKYGGDLEDRMRFPLEVIEEIMAKVEDDFTVGMRMAGEDFMGPESNTYEVKPIIAKEYEKRGLSFLDVTGGWHEARVPQLIMNVPEGCYTYLAQNIKEAVNIPVFASNRLQDPEIAEKTLQANKADAICIGRQLIADPYYVKKVMEGNLHDIMRCVSCNQGCFDAIFHLKGVTCLRNAAAGQERKMELKPIDEKKNIMVIGAGAAGLEAARVAAMRGHEVHLYEKDSKIGGLLNIISRPPGRSDFDRMVEDYEFWIMKYKINLHLNTAVDIQLVKERKPDAIMYATGAAPIVVPIPGIDREHVYWANDALAGDVPIGENCIVIGGGATGIELALFLAEYGAMRPDIFKFLMFYQEHHGLNLEDAMKMLFRGKKKVTVLEMLPKAGKSLGKSTKWALLGKCDKLGINIITSAKVTEIGEDYINYLDGQNNEQMINNVDAVYYATGVKPDNKLYKDIKKLNIPVYKIGDARKPQTVVECVQRAYKYANKL